MQDRYDIKTFEEIKGWKTETQLHKDCKTVFDGILPDGNDVAILVHHMNNQADEVSGSIAAAMGVREGMPDFQILCGQRSFFVEMKFGKGRLSKAQRKRIAQLKAFGHIVYEARNIREFLAVLFGELTYKLINMNGGEELFTSLAGTKIKML